MVLSQVIPSEVQDNTGDNIEKPGKILNQSTCHFIFYVFLPAFNIFLCGWRIVFSLLFLVLCAISDFVSLNHTCLLYFFS